MEHFQCGKQIGKFLILGHADTIVMQKMRIYEFVLDLFDYGSLDSA